jgi:hypothetical protein
MTILILMKIFWLYWHAVYAPAHALPAQLGAAIEDVIRKSVDKIGRYSKMLDVEDWESLLSAIRDWMSRAELTENVRSIMEGKLSGSLNSAPPTLVIRRLFDQLSLSLSEVETKAWRHRNLAAHGHSDGDPIQIILMGKVLRVLFHRLIAAVTKCSSQYIDYYSMGFPVRNLTEGVPSRS